MDREYFKKYRERNLEKERERGRKGSALFRKRHPERIKEWRKKWEKTEKCKEYYRKNRKKYRKSNIWLNKIAKRDGMVCKGCGATENLTINHIMPRCVGGKYSYSNLEILCQECNIKEYHKIVKKALKLYFSGQG
jgi:5-methylcytosine-specific restriction endonuclease McrA